MQIDDWYTKAIRRDTVNRQAEAIWPKRQFQPQRNYQPHFPPRNNQYRRTINEMPMESYDYNEPQPEQYLEPLQEENPEQDYEQDYYDEEDPQIQLCAVFTEEQNRRYQSGKCIGCGALGHFVQKCPNPDGNLSRNPPPKKPNFQPRRFPQPPPRRPFNNHRNPPPNNGNKKISVLEIQNMIRDLPLDERMEFREVYISDPSLKPYGDF